MISGLPALIAYLDRHAAGDVQTWRDWRIIPISGGANNLLCRATHKLQGNNGSDRIDGGNGNDPSTAAVATTP